VPGGTRRVFTKFGLGDKSDLTTRGRRGRRDGMRRQPAAARVDHIDSTSSIGGAAAIAETAAAARAAESGEDSRIGVSNFSGGAAGEWLSTGVPLLQSAARKLLRPAVKQNVLPWCAAHHSAPSLFAAVPRLRSAVDEGQNFADDARSTHKETRRALSTICRRSRIPRAGKQQRLSVPPVVLGRCSRLRSHRVIVAPATRGRQRVPSRRRRHSDQAGRVGESRDGEGSRVGEKWRAVASHPAQASALAPHPFGRGQQGVAQPSVQHSRSVPGTAQRSHPADTAPVVNRISNRRARRPDAQTRRQQQHTAAYDSVRNEILERASRSAAGCAGPWRRAGSALL